ncbi:expressed unknown protein [Seminavis robusta]|uniref:DUF6824 domain-containing protein n=1 Tax=Seminavis robusta TaxID=568900 RepID=A0A9N8H0E5_9STRA|nr:expressed unknown protein [Seminavis robusta]|eukprot:Sro1_g000400.1 n/a (317) ;mRNA; r:111943-113179
MAENEGVKRELDEGADLGSPHKKAKSGDDDVAADAGSDAPIVKLNDASNHAFVPPGTVGVTTINDNDVLSGRGGGTNLHPGNRQFRDLINLYRRDYLKARKNDKPAISRSIVNAIRDKNGRFLKKVEKSGLWFEIGDDAAREKTSQALRQRAPEMRKLLLDHEMEGARSQQQQMMMMPGMMMPGMMANGNMQMMAFNPAMMGMPNAAMFNPAMMGMPPMAFNQQGLPTPGAAEGAAEGGAAAPGGDGTAGTDATNNGGAAPAPAANNNPMMAAANFGMPAPANYHMMFAPMGAPMPGQPGGVPAPAPESPAPVTLQ